MSNIAGLNLNWSSPISWALAATIYYHAGTAISRMGLGPSSIDYPTGMKALAHALKLRAGFGLPSSNHLLGNTYRRISARGSEWTGTG